MNKAFDQVAAFQKLWMDSFANMASVWSQFSPGSPPSDEMRKMRGGMLKCWPKPGMNTCGRPYSWK